MNFDGGQKSCIGGMIDNTIWERRDAKKVRRGDRNRKNEHVINQVLFHSQVNHIDIVCASYPEDIVTSDGSKISNGRILCLGNKKRESPPYQDQAQATRVLAINKLLRIPKEHVHIRVNTLELAAVFRLSPFEADDEFSSYPARTLSEFLHLHITFVSLLSSYF